MRGVQITSAAAPPAELGNRGWIKAVVAGFSVSKSVADERRVKFATTLTYFADLSGY
jgi:hypothetical protein